MKKNLNNIDIRRLSKRSLALSFIGFYFIFQGLRVFGPEEPRAVLEVLYDTLPRETRGNIWVFLGLNTIAWAWTKKYQWVSVASAVALPVERVVSYTWLFFSYFTTNGEQGSLWCAFDAMRWLAVVGLTVVISGWFEWEKGRGPL